MIMYGLMGFFVLIVVVRLVTAVVRFAATFVGSR